jgi:hypothetical protein
LDIFKKEKDAAVKICATASRGSLLPFESDLYLPRVAAILLLCNVLNCPYHPAVGRTKYLRADYAGAAVPARFVIWGCNSSVKPKLGERINGPQTHHALHAYRVDYLPFSPEPRSSI